MSREYDVLAPGAEFAGIGPVPGIDTTDDDTCDVGMLWTESFDHIDEVVVPLEAGQPAGQDHESLAVAGREVAAPFRQPVVAGPEATPESGPVDAPEDSLHSTHVGMGIVHFHVSPGGVGNDDDPFAPGHDRAVAVHRIEAVHGGDETWPRGLRHSAPRQPADPGR